MPHEPRPLRFHAAEGPTDPLVALGDLPQAHYARSYLYDANAPAKEIK